MKEKIFVIKKSIMKMILFYNIQREQLKREKKNQNKPLIKIPKPNHKEIEMIMIKKKRIIKN